MSNNKKDFLQQKIELSPSDISFIFNLGRLWQEVVSEHWDNAIYLCEFIKEVSSLTIKKEYLKEFENLRRAIEEENYKGVDKVLERILGW